MAQPYRTAFELDNALEGRWPYNDSIRERLVATARRALELEAELAEARVALKQAGVRGGTLVEAIDLLCRKLADTIGVISGERDAAQAENRELRAKLEAAESEALRQHGMFSVEHARANREEAARKTAANERDEARAELAALRKLAQAVLHRTRAMGVNCPPLEDIAAHLRGGGK